MPYRNTVYINNSKNIDYQPGTISVLLYIFVHYKKKTKFRQNSNMETERDTLDTAYEDCPKSN